MQLCQSHDVPALACSTETVVRERWTSRLLYAATFLLMTIAASSGGAFIAHAWLTEQAPIALGGATAFFGVGFCLVFGLVGLSQFRAVLTPSNWLMRLRPEELVLKFRSDLNARLPEPEPVVVSLSYREIVWARKTVEWVRQGSLSGRDGTRAYRAYFLDLKLRLDDGTLTRLRTAIDAEIGFDTRRAHGRTLVRHYPVRLDGEVLRVQWWGALTPRLDAALAALSRHVDVDRELELSVDFTNRTYDNDAADQVLELARRGETLAAIGLARRALGLSLSDAKAFVEGRTAPA